MTCSSKTNLSVIVGAGLGSLLGGYTYEVFGARKLFAMCGAVSLCSMLLSLSVTVCLQAMSKR